MGGLAGARMTTSPGRSLGDAVRRVRNEPQSCCRDEALSGWLALPVTWQNVVDRIDSDAGGILDESTAMC